MRVLALAVFHDGAEDELVELAMRQARLTHPSRIAAWGSGVVALWVWEAIHAPRDGPISQPVREAIVAGGGKPNGGGRTPDTIATVLKAIERASERPIALRYEEAVRTCIRTGGDTDTTAAIAGGIAGALGWPIPKRLEHGLAGGGQWAHGLIHRLGERQRWAAGGRGR
jgi:ADP-ribosylglycohydrolase